MGERAPGPALGPGPARQATTLSYRSPDTAAAHSAVRIAGLLRERESLFWVKITAMLLSGIALSFVGPAMLATLFVRIAARHGEVMSWPAWFAIGSVTIIPLLFVVEWRTRGRFFEQSIEANALWLDGTPSNWGTWQLREAAGSILLVEVLLAAPRMTLNAIGQFLRRKPLGDVTAGRAAAIVWRLLQVEGRLGLDHLIEKDETPADFCRALRYLAFYDWIDIAMEGKHVWLLTQARKTLQSRGITSQ